MTLEQQLRASELCSSLATIEAVVQAGAESLLSISKDPNTYCDNSLVEGLLLFNKTLSE